MNGDKKKIIILGVLAVVIVGVGAFQLTASSGPATPPKEAAKSDRDKGANGQTTEPAAEDGTQTASNGGPAPAGGGNPASSSAPGDEGNVDPVAQAIGGPSADPVMGLYARGLAARDPFIPAGKAAASTEPERPTEPKPEPKPAAQRPPTPTRPPRELPPFSVAPGPLPGVGGPIGIQPGAPLRQPGEFSYTVSGVIVGAKPAAVFTDDSGRQRLVPAGGALDGDSRVVSVTADKVVIRHRGKTLTLSVGGTTNAQ
ncbi:MAG: hypothetical protein SNJ76_10575 [Fimbriimonadaceae bacterium]